MGSLGNGGDLLSRFVVEAMTGRSTIPARGDDPHKLCAIGSIIFEQLPRSGGHWWGSGLRNEQSLCQAPGNVFHAVRGPLTRAQLLRHGYECPAIYGDPALLLPRLYPCRPTRRFPLGVVCHFSHRHMLALAEGVLDINIMRQDWELQALIEEICSCEFILASSLHGIIIAHAYGIPAQWLVVEGYHAEPAFKYHDYFSAVGMPPQVPLLCDSTCEISLHTVRRCGRCVDLKIDLDALADAFPYEELAVSRPT